MANLLTALRDTKDDQTRSLASFLVPEEFDFVCQVVTSLRVVKDDKRTRNTFVLKLGYDLNRCADLLWGQAVKNRESPQVIDGYYRFGQLYAKEWATKVSSRALKSLYNTKMNKVKEQPLDGDIVKLADGLKEEVKKLTSNFEENTSWRFAKPLMDACIGSLLIFNR